MAAYRDILFAARRHPAPSVTRPQPVIYPVGGAWCPSCDGRVWCTPHRLRGPVPRHDGLPNGCFLNRVGGRAKSGGRTRWRRGLSVEVSEPGSGGGRGHPRSVPPCLGRPGRFTGGSSGLDRPANGSLEPACGGTLIPTVVNGGVADQHAESDECCRQVEVELDDSAVLLGAAS